MLKPGFRGCSSTDDKNLDWSKLKEFEQTTILSLMKMAESSHKSVENTVGKGEIARYEQFLLFPQCFQTTLSGDT